jgi:hypothetical protein
MDVDSEISPLAGSERAGYLAVARQRSFANGKFNGLIPARWLRDLLELPTWLNSRIDCLCLFAYGTLA